MRRAILLPQSGKRQILSPTQVMTTGRSGQIRQGRQLANADFTDQGLSTPRALWNLGSTADASGNGFTLTNGGGVTFGSGVTGATTEAAIFNKNGTTGFLSASNSIKQGYGTWGCWFRTTPTEYVTPAEQTLMAMVRAVGDYCFRMTITDNKELQVLVHPTGASTVYNQAIGYGCPVSDDVWHFAAFTWDGAQLLLYLDGHLIAANTITSGATATGPIYTAGTGLLYLGAWQITTAIPFSGRIDEAFVTRDILKPHHFDYLRAVKIAHGLPSPRMVRARRYHYDKTAVLASSDFTSQPLVGYNFLSGQLTTDHYGSLGKTLTNTGTCGESPSPDGGTGGVSMISASNQSLGASDASLPSGTANRTVGWMMRRRIGSTFETCWSYGTFGVAGQEMRFDADSAGRLRFVTGAAVETQQFLAAQDQDWTWYHYVYDNGHPAGVRHKVYVNGTCHMVGVNALNTVLAGAARFRLGENPDGSANADHTLQNFFITNYAMQPDEVRRQVDKQGDLIGISEIDSEDFLVDIDATHVYCIFTGVSPRDSIELMVEA